MKVTRTLVTTALTLGLMAGGTAVVSAPAQAAGEAGSQNQTNSSQNQTQRTDEERRAVIIDRAQTWVDQQVPYDMNGYYPDPQGNEYRTDCSGFVSMAWGLNASENTVTLPNVSDPIDKEDLKPGDILLKGGPGTEGANGHVTIFNGWANDEHTAYHGIEEGGSTGSVAREIAYPYEQDDAFVPYRFTGL